MRIINRVTLSSFSESESINDVRSTVRRHIQIPSLFQTLGGVLMGLGFLVTISASSFGEEVEIARAAELSAAEPDQEGSDEKIRPAYKTGYFQMVRLGRDIYRTMEPKYRKLISPEPVFLETDVTPFVRPVTYDDPDQPIRAVFVSAGFIDLVNNVAHAQAIDRLERGFFKRYIKILSSESGARELRELPGLNNDEFWTEDVLDEQHSLYNQIVTAVIAIKLSHHYLGHYDKYKDQIENEFGKSIPINNLLTDKEWEESLNLGIENALDSGIGVDGVKTLFEALDQMPVRPDWTAYFLPDNVKIKKVLKTLDKLEKKYFAF